MLKYSNNGYEYSTRSHWCIQKKRKKSSQHTSNAIPSHPNTKYSI